MLKGLVTTEEVTIPPEKEEVIHLQESDLKAIIQCLLDLSYNKETDVYECPNEIINLGEELGIS